MMKTFNTVAIQTDINGVESNEELTALFGKALELCQAAKSSERSLSPSSLDFPVSDAEINGGSNEYLVSMHTVCAQIKQEIEPSKETSGSYPSNIIANGKSIKNEPNIEDRISIVTCYSEQNPTCSSSDVNPEALNIHWNTHQNISLALRDHVVIEENARGKNKLEKSQSGTPDNVHTEEKIETNQTLKLCSKKNTICPYCNKEFSRGLKRHLITHTKEKPFQCQHCEKAFTRREHLKEHTRRHLGVKPYKCSLCDKSFIRNSEIKIHMRIHTGENTIQCKICKKEFVHKTEFIEHSKTHIGSRPYKCEICDKFFALKCVLKQHMRTHTIRIRAHKCEACGKSFVSKSHLVEHLQIHTGERPHQCRICLKTFLRRYHLNRHLNTHFKNNT